MARKTAEAERAYRQRYYQKNRERVRTQQKEYHQRTREARHEKQKEYYQLHKEEHAAACTRFRQRLRDRVLEKLGNKCAVCGFTDKRALQVDHVNGGGRTERREVAYTTMYQMVLQDQCGKYQLLCANCNLIKSVENGERRGARINTGMRRIDKGAY